MLHDVRAESAVTFQDGRVALCGYRPVSSSSQPFVAVLNADGSIDRGFGAGGAMAFWPRMSGETARVVASAVDSSGRLLVGGVVGSGGDLDFFVARILATGELDAGFGAAGSGIVAFDPYAIENGLASSTSSNTLTGLAIDASGRILVAGTCNAGNNDWIVARLRADGILDTSFGNTGRGTAMVESDAPDSCRGVAAIGNEALLFGSYNTGNTSLLRLQENGLPYASSPWTGSPVSLGLSVTAQAMALRDIDSDGLPELYLAGRLNTSVYAFRFRLEAASISLDEDYSTATGRQVAGMDADVSSLAAAADGSCLIVATTAATPSSALAVRLGPTGLVDASFEQGWSDETYIDGVVGLPLGGTANGDSAASALALADGRWLVAGSAYDDGHARWRGYAAMLEPSGAYRTTFDGDGIASAGMLPENLEYSATAAFEDGRIVAAGQYWEGGVRKAFFDLYAADGQGPVRSVLHQDGMTRSSVGAAALGSDGSVYIGWTYEESGSYFAVSKIEPSGAYDPSYGTGGRTSYSNPGYLEYQAASLAIGSDGTAFLGGQAVDNNGIENIWVLLRFDPTGTNEWGGIKTVGNNQQGGTDCVTGIDIAPDGSVYIAGTTYDMSTTHNENAFAARFSAAGSIDASFDHDGDGDGVYYLGLDSRLGADIDSAAGIALDRDGTAIVYGSARTGMEPFTGIGWSIRLGADGTIDSAYGTGGAVRLGSGTDLTSIVGGALHPDGSLTVAGMAGGQAYVGRFAQGGNAGIASAGQIAPRGSQAKGTATAPNGVVAVTGLAYGYGITYGFVSLVR